MPAFTANRNYPYSIPTDPTKIPAAVQALAEAVDTDLQSLEFARAGRPMFRVRGTQNRTVAPGSFTVPFIWDTVDFDNGALDMSSLGTDTLHPAGGDAFVATTGRWLVIVTAVCPPTTGAGLLSYGVRIQDNTGGQRTETRLHNFPAPTETAGRTIPAANWMDSSSTPGLGIQAYGLLERSASNNPYTYREQTLTAVLMSRFF